MSAADPGGGRPGQPAPQPRPGSPARRAPGSARNRWEEELNKCCGREVMVTCGDGKVLTGICKAINFNSMSVVLMTEADKILISNPLRIKRARTFTTDGHPAGAQQTEKEQ